MSKKMSKPVRRTVWRNRYIFGAGFAIWMIAGLAMFSSGQSGGISKMVFPGTFLTVICYFVSFFTMFARIKLTPDALIVRNPGVELTIPWSLVQVVEVRRGLEIGIKSEIEPVPSAAYQGSIIGRMLGYPSARKAKDAIERYSRSSARPSSETTVSRLFPWRVHLRWFLTGWLIVTVVLPLFSALTVQGGDVRW